MTRARDVMAPGEYARRRYSDGVAAPRTVHDAAAQARAMANTARWYEGHGLRANQTGQIAPCALRANAAWAAALVWALREVLR